MFYTVYKITNLIDGKYYIGVHQTRNLLDGYMGSGRLIQQEQQRCGMNNFVKEILFVFDNPDEMFAKEAELVSKNVAISEETYNLKRGGNGSNSEILSDDCETVRLTFEINKKLHLLLKMEAINRQCSMRKIIVDLISQLDA